MQKAGMDSRLRLAVKSVAAKVRVWLVLSVCAYCGCDAVPNGNKWPGGGSGRDAELALYVDYGPVRIDVLPLTEFEPGRGLDAAGKIKVYVSLLDKFGSEIKAPGVFRFELHQYVERSARQKGRRIAIWPDVDLTDPAENNRYWRDFLRAYLFELDFELQANQRYMLQVTCLCPSGKRLSEEFTLGR